MTTVLHIDSSARKDGSVSREISSRAVARLEHNGAQVIRRDLIEGEQFLNEDWVSGTFTPKDARSETQALALAHSDQLVAELQSADAVVLGMSMYNFGVPAVLKAWMDLVARAGVTFQYTENGPVGLLGNKKVIIAFASGGVPHGSPMDFASPHLVQFFKFLGVEDISFEFANENVELEVEEVA